MIEQLIKDLLKELGEDPYREGLSKTPERVAKSFGYLTSGRGKTAAEGGASCQPQHCATQRRCPSSRTKRQRAIER